MNYRCCRGHREEFWLKELSVQSKPRLRCRDSGGLRLPQTQGEQPEGCGKRNGSEIKTEQNEKKNSDTTVDFNHVCVSLCWDCYEKTLPQRTESLRGYV
jgi:hypothetical protein